MEFTRRYLPMEWEERWRREKERKKKVIEEGGEGIEQDDCELRRIVAYNDSRMGLTSWKDKKQGSEFTMSGTSQEVTREPMGKDLLGEERSVDNVHTYRSKTYPKKVFQALKEFRDSSLLTDLTLTTEDGKSFHVHSVVLAAVSSFILETLRERSGKGSDNATNAGVQMWSVSPASQVDCIGLQAVVEFAYTGVVSSLNTDTMAQIKMAAQILGVSRLMDLCNKVEGKKESRSTKKYEEKFSALEQMKITLQSIEQLWVERVACDVILDVDGATFCVHRVILAATSDYFRGIEVRAVNLRMECFGNKEVELYGSALKEFGFSLPKTQDQCRVRRPKDALVLVGGDQLNPDVGQRIPSRELWFANSLRSGTGLDDMMKSAYSYDPEHVSWKRLADMQEVRSNFSVVVHEEHIYAIGGDTDINTNVDSVEMYNPDTDSWSFAQALDQALSGYAASVLNGGIFISGGFNCKYVCLVSMFLYHPEGGTTYLADMNHDRAQHCMEALRGRLYVAGGVCNLRKFYTDQQACEVYDPVTDSWTDFASLPVPHVGAASVVLEEKIYILGGYCQDDYSESGLVHRFEPSTQRWENMGKLPGAVTDIRACLLRLPQHYRQ
ncbi:hypothetical protein Q5P01_002467 [Channa striata]|uniref:BTB domain-containing protein n=1 Tax=Channa striata TaxID=64152 RepID=A0AA88NRF2_CHASR|nr:hypothetical protein Q5P01_002467 [Channa striata]